MKNRKGLTLIEVILSIALISLIAITFLGMFNMSNKFIFKAGNKTKSVIELKKEMDKEIRKLEENPDEMVEVDENPIILTIPGVIEDYPVGGTTIEKEDPEDSNIKITTFVPNKKVNP